MLELPALKAGYFLGYGKEGGWLTWHDETGHQTLRPVAVAAASAAIFVGRWWTWRLILEEVDTVVLI